MDSHLYLQSNSCHNPESIDGIQKDMALRFRQIYSSEQDYLKKSRKHLKM